MPEPKRLSHDLYAKLPLPWDVGVSGFDKSTVFRKQWDATSALSDGNDSICCVFWESTVESFKHLLDNDSRATRWRAAHPELAGTNQDCVALVMDRLRKILGISRNEEKDKKIKVGLETVLLMIKASS